MGLNKKILLLGTLILIIGLVIAATRLESEKDVTGETREIIESKTRSLIEESEDAKEYYFDDGKFPEETKTEVKTFKGTNTVIVTTYYSNGKKATTVTTKDKIGFIER